MTRTDLVGFALVAFAAVESIGGCGGTQAPAPDTDTTASQAPLDPVTAEPSGSGVEPEPSGGEVAAEQTARVAFTQCDPEARPTVCTKEYRAVCGEVDNGVRCITTPCESTERRTFSNACMACADAKTHGYWPNACDTPPQDAR